MCKCDNCNKVFEEPDTYSEVIGEFWGIPAREYFGICPYCGSDEIIYDYEETEEENEDE